MLVMNFNRRRCHELGAYLRRFEPNYICLVNHLPMVLYAVGCCQRALMVDWDLADTTMSRQYALFSTQGAHAILRPQGIKKPREWALK